MSIFRQLILVELAALLALLIVSGAMTFYGAADSAWHADTLLTPAASAKLLFGYTLIIGFFPVVVIGAPGYVVLLRKHLARWPYALGLGVLPGLLALPFELSLGFWAIICGAAVAFLTHVMCRRLGPNNSFKPNPLRGSA